MPCKWMTTMKKKLKWKTKPWVPLYISYEEGVGLTVRPLLFCFFQLLFIVYKRVALVVFLVRFVLLAPCLMPV